MKAQDLKNSILQLAIQGRLVAQDANDEPAEVLYAKIQAEKQKLIKEGKIKKDKPLPPITDDEIPFTIPSTWKWVRLGDMCLNIFCGKSPKYSVVETPHKIIGQQANQDDGLDFKYIKYGTSAFVKDMPEMYYLKNYDVLLNTLGGGTIGRSGMYVSNKYEKLLTDGHLFVFRLLDISTAIYLLFYLKLKRSEIERNANGSTNQTFLNLGETKQWLIPLPPLAEQKRIVSKVNDLMQYCEELGHPEKRKNVEPITIGWLIDKGFASCQQNGYTDVNAILDELGIAVMQDRNLKKGRIEYNNDKFQIWVNDLNDNWTKTHELVHYVNDNNEIKLYGAVGRKDETSLSKSKERNVDVLTAEILMPEDIFVSAVEQDNIGKYAFVDNATIRKLGKQFRVSDDAVKIRLQNLGYHTK